MSRGTVSLAPTPEDKRMEATGSFYWTLREIERRAANERYAGVGSERERARRLGQTVRQFRTMQDRVLLRLAGWLAAGVFNVK